LNYRAKRMLRTEGNGLRERARLLNYATSGDTMVVWRVDRLGRSLIDVLNTVKLLREKGLASGRSRTGSTPSPRQAG